VSVLPDFTLPEVTKEGSIYLLYPIISVKTFGESSFPAMMRRTDKLRQIPQIGTYGKSYITSTHKPISGKDY
jgi:hypothetical protein